MREHNYTRLTNEKNIKKYLDIGYKNIAILTNKTTYLKN